MIAVVLFLMAGGVSAQKRNEIGGIVGMTNGLSFKHFGTEKFASQTDFGVGIRYAPFSAYGYAMVFNCWDFHLNQNFMYQTEVSTYPNGALDFYIGAGFTLGEVNDYGNNSCVGGILGLNVILGFEYLFENPVSFSFDFRPGYGLFFDYDSAYSAFDWTLNISLRYRF